MQQHKFVSLYFVFYVIIKNIAFVMVKHPTKKQFKQMFEVKSFKFIWAHNKDRQLEQSSKMYTNFNRNTKE